MHQDWVRKQDLGDPDLALGSMGFTQVRDSTVHKDKKG